MVIDIPFELKLVYLIFMISFFFVGVGLDKAANIWAFDTSQFDNILKQLKVVRYYAVTFIVKFIFYLSVFLIVNDFIS